MKTIAELEKMVHASFLKEGFSESFMQTQPQLEQNENPVEKKIREALGISRAGFRQTLSQDPTFRALVAHLVSNGGEL